MIGLKVDDVRRIITSPATPPPAAADRARHPRRAAHRHRAARRGVYLLIDIENVLSGDEKRELAEADLTAAMRGRSRRSAS